MVISVDKIVVDTNIFITILGKKSPNRWIFDKLINGEFELCISNDILCEYEEILIEKTNTDVARNVIDFLLTSPFVHLVDIFFFWQIIENDPSDNKFIDCAITSGALCLVSNDQHFNVLKNIDFPKLKVYNIEEFTSLYNE